MGLCIHLALGAKQPSYASPAWPVSLDAELIPSCNVLGSCSVNHTSPTAVLHSHMHHPHYVFVLIFSVREGKIQLAACFNLISVDCRSVLMTLSLTSEITELLSSPHIFLL